jgi:hypothetical protein
VSETDIYCATSCANCGEPLSADHAIELFTGAFICEACAEAAFVEVAEQEDDELRAMAQGGA